MKKIFTILFFALLGLNNINAATFVSKASGAWNGGLTTWTITAGTDTDKIPDLDDNVTIAAGHTITISTAAESAKTLLNNGNLKGNGHKLNMYGNLTNNGSSSNLVIYIQAPCVFSSSVFFNGATQWWIYKNLTISAGTSFSVQSSMSINTSTVTNLGSANVGGAISYNNGSARWINGAASSLSLSVNSTTTGVLDASAVGNTVTYLGTSKQIKTSASYYNLVLNGTTTKSVTANLVVQNDLTLGAGATNIFNLNNRTLTLGGNWTNNSNNSITNQGVVTFTGSGTQTITRSSNEIINNMIVGGTGTVLLGTSLTSTSLSVNSGTLDVSASNYTVNVGGNLINNSTINARSGLFNFNGAAAQTVSGSATNTFYNVTSVNAAGVSISSPSIISNILAVSAGAFGTSGAGAIKIPATGATTYGRIGTVGGSLTGTGWTIESYIDGPAPKGWQWLSSPINGNKLADWDNDTRFWMSGVGGNDGNAGTFKSVRTYNEPTNTRTNITSTTTTLAKCKGYEVYMSDNLTTGLTAPLIYNSVGTPNFGNASIAITAGGVGGGYNLVGNPYACPITYSAVVAASGGIIDASFIILLESGAYVTDPNGGIIAPNQGFMCAATSGGSINFTEACKNTTTLPNILRTAPKNNALTFSVFNNINGLGGQTSVEFLESSADVFEHNKDLSFLASPYDDADNIWTSSSDSKSMLRNSLNNKDNEKNVPLTVKSGVYGLHTISVKGLSSITDYNSVVLEDLNSGKKIDLLKEQNYYFDANEIGKEYHFMVHFSKSNQTDLTSSKTVQENTLNNNTSVYNTPSNVIVKFDMVEATPVQISVYNLSGQQVIAPMNVTVTNDRIALPLQKENGLYLLIIKSKDQQITRKIIY